MPVNEPTATKIAKEENMALHSQTDHITKDKVVSEEKDSKNRRSDNLTDSEDFTERLKKKCYQALASDSEVTHEQLKESAEFLDTVVIFNFTKVRGAQKKFIRKMKKQLRGPSSFPSGALTNNNYKCNNDNYNNKYSNVNNNNNVKTTTQDLSGTRRRDRDVPFSEREEKICDRCGKMAKHRAAECQGDAFKVRRSAYTTSSSSSRKPRDHLSDDDESNQKCDSKRRESNSKQSCSNDNDSDDNIYDRIKRYNAKANVASVVNFDDHVYSHYTRGKTNSEGVYALVTKSVKSDREEV